MGPSCKSALKACEEMLHEGNAAMSLTSRVVGFSQQFICVRMPVTFLQWDFLSMSLHCPELGQPPQ